MKQVDLDELLELANQEANEKSIGTYTDDSYESWEKLLLMVGMRVFKSRVDKVKAEQQELLVALEKIASMDLGMNHHVQVIAKIMREIARDAITNNRMGGRKG